MYYTDVLTNSRINEALIRLSLMTIFNVIKRHFISVRFIVVHIVI